jgi:hypothetical protein
MADIRHLPRQHGFSLLYNDALLMAAPCTVEQCDQSFTVFVLEERTVEGCCYLSTPAITRVLLNWLSPGERMFALANSILELSEGQFGCSQKKSGRYRR